MIPILEGIAPFARRSLRGRSPSHFVFLSLLITAVLSFAVLWIDHTAETRTSLHDLLIICDVVCLSALGLLGLVLGPALAGATMAHELRIGTVDQLRMTPLGAGRLALGISLGSPALAYLLMTGPLAFHCLFGVLHVVPLGAVLISLLVILAASIGLGLCFTALPLFLPRNRVSAGIVALPVGFLLIANAVAMSMATTNASAPWSYLFPAGALHALYLDQVPFWQEHFFLGYAHSGPAGWYLFLPLASILSSLVLFGFGALIAVRQLKDPERPALDKAHALLGFAVLGLLVLLPVWLDQDSLFSYAGTAARDRLTLAAAVLFIALPVMIPFAVLCAPSKRRWLTYLRRDGLSALHEGAPVHRSVFLMSLILLLQVSALVLGRSGVHQALPWEGGKSLLGVALWVWILLVISTGLQVLRAVVETTGTRVLVAAGILSAFIGVLVCTAWIDAESGYRSEVRATLLVLGSLPLILFLAEWRARSRLRA